jgi:hypothetical protein
MHEKLTKQPTYRDFALHENIIHSSIFFYIPRQLSNHQPMFVLTEGY